jgi:hypothetical protein
MEEGETCPVSASVGTKKWTRDFCFSMARESTMDEVNAPKKKLRGFPDVFYI